LRRRPPILRTLAALVVVGLIAWLGWLWYQGSSFVRIRHVTVTGLSGPDVSAIRSALTVTALQMTTMKLQVERLEEAVSAYPFVESITVQRHGAHAVTIDVAEQVPVAMVDIGGEAEVVDGRDQILGQSAIPHGLLPQLTLGTASANDTVTDPNTRAEVATLAAAPYAMLAHIQSASWNRQNGVVVALRSGPQVYFGAASELTQKWQDAVAVLQNSASRGAAYIDVSDPGRPAAGVSVTSTQVRSLGLEPGTSTTAQAAASATTTGPTVGP